MLCTDPDGGTVRYPVEGGSPKPIPGLAAGDDAEGWSIDGRSIFISPREGNRARVFRQNLATGERELWREFVCPDRAGLVGKPGFVFTPDEKAYAYNCFCTPSDLYLVTGLR